MSIKHVGISLIITLIYFGSVNAQVKGELSSAAVYDDSNIEKESPLNLPDVLALCGSEEGEVEIGGKFKEIRWNTGAKTPYITVQDTGIYSVSVFDGIDWFHDSIHVIRVPELQYRPTQTSVLCEGKILRITGNIESKSWAWSNGSNKWGISVSNPGDYYVTSSNDCYTVTDTFRIIKAGGFPTHLSYQIPTCLRNNIPLSAFGPAENYRWNTGQSTQDITVNNGGDFTVNFKVCDSVFTQTFSVDVKARSANPLYFPNVFTPNGDHTNDDFRMIGTNDQITDFQISIFNRWGILLFKSNSQNFEWDGIYKGNIVPDGVYFYGGGYKHNCSGDQYIPIEGSITVQH